MRARALLAGLFGAVMLAHGAGCSGESDSRGRDDGAGSQDPLLAFYRELFRAKCAFDVRCVEQNGRAHVSLDACLRGIDYLVEVLDQLRENGTTLFDYLAIAPGADYRPCAESIYPTNTCDSPPDDSLSPECARVVTYVGAGREGEVCYDGPDSVGVCVPGTTCTVSDGCGYCRARVRMPNGAACVVSGECTSDHCAGGFCATPKPRGAACTSDAECRAHLHCVGAPGASTCADAAGEGEACEFDSSCVDGLSCRGTPPVCILDAPAGTPCDRSESVTCEYLCEFATADAPSGRCGASVPGPGEACAYTGGTPLCFDSYANRSSTTGGVDTACVCTPRGKTGDPCRVDGDCESYSCSALGSCDSPKADGSDCTSDATCASAYCGPGQLCAQRPSCG